MILRDRDRLYVVSPGEPDDQLIYYKDLQFSHEKESGVIIEFVEEGGQITAPQAQRPVWRVSLLAEVMERWQFKPVFWSRFWSRFGPGFGHDPRYVSISTSRHGFVVK